MDNAVTIQAGATLAGTGSVSATTVSGLLAAGDNLGAAMGTLTFNTSLSLAAGSVTTLQLSTADAQISTLGELASLTDPGLSGTDDFIQVNQQLSIAGGAMIELDFTGYTAQWGDVFDLFDFGIAPTELPMFSVVGGSLGDLTLDTSRFLDLGVVALAPEPSRLLLLGFGWLLVWGRRHR